MSSRLSTALVMLLAVALIVPPTFFAPQRAHAGGIPVIDVSNLVQNTFAVIKDTLIEIHTFTTKVATVAMWVNTFILQPLLFVLSGRLLQHMTSQVLAFVNGTINKTGAPQFVQSLQGNMQLVGDIAALSFIDQYRMTSRSPFSASITSALYLQYLQGATLAGYFAANRDTLRSTSPNINAYLAGDWSQGGLTSWFALTTQDNNNPYMLYLNAQSQARSLVGPGVGGARGARKEQLSWGQGMLSWCGTEPQTPVDTSVDVSGGTGTNPDDLNPDGSGNLKPGILPTTNLADKLPGDDCISKDGVPGKVKTPGSVISASLNKALGATQDKIIQMGALANEVNGILRDIQQVMRTVNLARNILVGPDSGGLAGTNKHDTYGTSVFLGVSNANVYQNAAQSSLYTSDTAGLVDQYESAWLTIKSSADFAASSTSALAGPCSAAAQTALTTEIQPVLGQAASAAAAVAAARAMLQKIQDELNAGQDASADTQALKSMPPSATDVANALQESQSTGGATANPEGSLTVSGGSIVDRMNLIRANAGTMVCTP